MCTIKVMNKTHYVFSIVLCFSHVILKINIQYFSTSHLSYEMPMYEGKSESKVPYFIATKYLHILRCLFIHLKFTHWSLDERFFVAQAPQFLWATQFGNGYCTVCVDTRRGSINYSVFVGKRDSSN